jgi:hypothetical protein
MPDRVRPYRAGAGSAYRSTTAGAVGAAGVESACPTATASGRRVWPARSGQAAGCRRRQVDGEPLAGRRSHRARAGRTRLPGPPEPGWGATGRWPDGEERRPDGRERWPGDLTHQDHLLPDAVHRRLAEGPVGRSGPAGHPDGRQEEAAGPDGRRVEARCRARTDGWSPGEDRTDGRCRERREAEHRHRLPGPPEPRVPQPPGGPPHRGGRREREASRRARAGPGWARRRAGQDWPGRDARSPLPDVPRLAGRRPDAPQPGRARPPDAQREPAGQRRRRWRPVRPPGSSSLSPWWRGLTALHPWSRRRALQVACRAEGHRGRPCGGRGRPEHPRCSTNGS